MQVTEPSSNASGGTAELLSHSALMSFGPVNRIHQCLVGLHCYSTDRTRLVPSVHYCSCGPESSKFKGFRQCIIFDSTGPDARLIGIEYVVPEQVFESLDKEEKRFWHSHKHEVEGGILQLGTKSLVPQVGEDLAEKGPMTELHQTYGKTIHTWAYDKYPDLPLGPPHLMMSLQADDKIAPGLQQTYEEMAGTKIRDKQDFRQEYLDLSYQPKPGADSRDGVEFVVASNVGQRTGGPGDLRGVSDQSRPSV
ncbi:hypothetical protein OIV83_004641 [Microbotryomycetes sp. JL201]|nr:hypothetical protein OIV83_004641 [Microbotryomycetes sp. JL201]